MADTKTATTKTYDIGQIALPTFEHAVTKGHDYCSQLYSDAVAISGYMDRAENGGTPVWWQIDDLIQKLADHLGMED